MPFPLAPDGGDQAYFAVVIGFGVGFGIQKIGLNDVGRTWLGRLNKARSLKHVGCHAVIFLFL